MSLATGVRRAVQADRPAMTAVLCRAFDADPVVNWIVRQDSRRRAALEWLFKISLDMAMPHGHVYTTTDGRAVALWAPPGRWRTGRARQLGQLPGFVRAVGLRRLSAVVGAVAAIEARHPDEPHFYLADLAVDPAVQGRGLGSALIAHVLESCDRDGVPAYLENSNPRNTPLYERHGFVARERYLMGGDGPPLLLMWREPRSSS
jgi:ribosomal protein S18 acetylase RimI-like enzyme